MKILEYVGLDTSRVQAQYEKVRDAIARDDFRQAGVKKLANLSHGKFYRAKLDYANRLLFSMVRHGDTAYALMLEVIEQHAYDKCRFLRGANVQEERIPDVEATAAAADAMPVRYIHPARRDIHLLDKVISFDDAQDAVYRLPPPLIVVGSAGSGKTALTLEKLKHAEGEVLYVTHSAYLARWRLACASRSSLTAARACLRSVRAVSGLARGHRFVRPEPRRPAMAPVRRAAVRFHRHR